MRVIAIILALAAGASGCRRLTNHLSCSSNENEEQCANTCGPCVGQESWEGTGRRNLRFGAAATGCCAEQCRRRLTAEETAALSAGQREERRRLGC